MNIKDNTRTKITKTKIENEFLNLLEQYQIEKITIRKICESAKINPSTFYFHYKDIYDLMEEIEKNMMYEVENAFWDDVEKRFKLNILEFLNVIEKNKKFYKIYLNKNGSLMKLNMNPKNIKKEDVGKERIYKYNFFNGGTTAIIKKWLESDCLDSKEMIEKIILEMLYI